MGQYHQFMNFDKKEVCYPPGLQKLMEWSYQGNEYLNYIENLLKTTWKGDRVLVVGDYVQDHYDDLYYSDFLKSIRDENKNQPSNSIYNYNYKEVPFKKIKSLPSRYIYNHQTKRYVDLKNLPIQWAGYDEKHKCIYGNKIHPLSLLISCSNGLGGGDYHGKNMQYVASWMTHSNQIELSDVPLNDSYQELKVSFDEYETNKSNADILSDAIVEYMKKSNVNIEIIQFDPDLFLTKEEKKDIINFALNKIKLEERQKDMSKSDLDEIEME